jgi:uncharacterized HAD superfamily protein
MDMKVGIDIDNVLALTYEGIIEEIKQFGMNVKLEEWVQYDFWNAFNITEEETWNMFNQIIDNGFFTKVNLMPACSYVIARNGFQKFYITSRLTAIEEQTKAWMEENGIHYDEDKLFFVGRGSWIYDNVPRFKRKAFVAEKLKLDCFIEDEGEVAYEIAELGIPVILFNFPWNQHVKHKNIYRVGHWNDKCSYWRETENVLKMIKKKIYSSLSYTTEL